MALYCRVSTKDKGQTTENQRRALEQWAANAGCTVVATFEDKVSGAKGRDKRPQFEAWQVGSAHTTGRLIGSPLFPKNEGVANGGHYTKVL